MKYLKSLTFLPTILLFGCNAGSNSAATNAGTSNESTMVYQYQNKNTTDNTVSSLASKDATPSQNLAGYRITAVYEESGVIYAGTTSGLFISNDMGNSWTLKNSSNGLPSNQIQQIIGDSYGVYAIIGGNAMVSVDHGQTWTILLQHDIPDFDSITISNGKIYLGYDGGIDLYNCKDEKSKMGIAVSSNHGKDWAITTNMQIVGHTANSLSVYSNQIYFIDKCWNHLALSNDGGSNWSYLDDSGVYVLPNANGYLKRVISNGNNIYVASSTGLSISTNKGSSFNYITTANGLPSNNINDIFLAESGTQLIVATDNGYAISYDNGKSFMSVSSSELNQLPASNVTSTYADNYLLLFGTESGMTVFNRSTNFSQTQKPMIHSDYVAYSSIFPTANLLYIGTTGDGIKIWDQTRRFWQSITKTGESSGIIDNHIYQITVYKGKTYVATGGGLSISEDNIHWNNITKSQGLASNFVQSVAISGNNIYLASTDYGISYSHNGGVTWESLTFPDVHAGRDDLYPYMAVKSVFAESQNVYAATDDGIYISRDNGTSWSTYLNERTSSTSTNRDIYQIFANGKYIYATSDDGLWTSNDNGYSWTQHLSGIRIVMVEVKGGLIYVTLRDGGEAISKDNGKTFTISNNLGYASYSMVYYLQANQWWGSYLTTTSIPYTLGIDYNYASYYTL